MVQHAGCERWDVRGGKLPARRNVRHAFFQPAENEMITLVHFRLHNPIMVRCHISSKGNVFS